jgi:hypothetical protein
MKLKNEIKKNQNKNQKRYKKKKNEIKKMIIDNKTKIFL